MSADRTPAASVAANARQQQQRQRIRAARFHLIASSVFIRLLLLAAALLAVVAAGIFLQQPLVVMTVALPALIATVAAIWAYGRSRTTVSIDTDGIRYRQGGRVRAIVSWSDYMGWQREPSALLLLQDRDDSVRIPTGGRNNAWEDLTAALDEIRPRRTTITGNEASKSSKP
jgi:hypothetical protein